MTLSRTLRIAMIAGAFALASLAYAVSQKTERTSKLDELRWLAGTWEFEHGGVVIEESWIAPRGGLMLGCGRTLAQEKAVAFEFLRIEEREAGVYYVAHPGARSPGTEFMLTTSAKDSWTFENPDHDFPRVIRYSKSGEASFEAHLEGVEKDKPVVQDFHFRRPAK